jgi:hypothetical protein
MENTTNDVASNVGASTGASSSALRELEQLRERERQMVELLGADSPDRLLHDLRNLLNELTLLRAVIETDETK